MRTTRQVTAVLASLATLAALLALPGSVFAAAPEKPETTKATSVTAEAAVLNGVVNPKTSVEKVEYWFQAAAGTEAGCVGEHFAPESIITENLGVTAEGKKAKASQPLAGLIPHQEYTYCLFDRNIPAEGEEQLTTEGNPVTFKTASVAAKAENPTATNVSPFSETVEATVNAENETTTCRVEYGTTIAANEHAAPCEPGAGTLTGFGPQQVSATLTGLTSNTLYHYKVVATNATGKAEPAGEFTTSTATKPLLENVAIANVGQTTASLSAAANPDFQSTTVGFHLAVSSLPLTLAEFASDPLIAGTPPTLTGDTLQPFTASLTDLSPNTSYDYDAAAENETGTTEVAGTLFRTLPLPPTLTTGGASAVSPNTATVAGSVNPGSTGPNSSTTFYFQYGETESYGTQTTIGQAGEGTAPVPETATLAGLTPNRTYHYRITATNDTPNTPQTVHGADETFQTPATPPEATTGGAANVGSSTVTLTGAVQARGLATSYEFSLGTSPANDLPVGGGYAGSSSEPAPVAFAVSGLAPGTVYYYRLTATSEDGTSTGTEGTFTTTGAPAAPPEAAPPKLFPDLSALAPTPFAKEAGSAPPSKPLTRAQKLAKALKACTKKPKSKRAACRTKAREAFGPVKHKKARKATHR